MPTPEKSSASDFSVEQSHRPKHVEPLAPTIKLPEIDLPLQHVPTDHAFQTTATQENGKLGFAPLYILAILVVGVIMCIVFLIFHR